MKIHPSIVSFTGSKIVVRGKYDRKNSIISALEKNDKLCNWKRPTVNFSDDFSVLYVNCFPGIDYVYHYAALIQTFFNLNRLQVPVIVVEVPTQIACLEQLSQSHLDELPESDIIILGKVDRLQGLIHKSWQGGDDFYWSTQKMYGKKITLLGCAFSIWGDIAGNLIRVLKNKQVKAVLYVGKLGVIFHQSNILVNSTLATGVTSMLNGKLLTWKQCVNIPTNLEKNVQHGNHITLFSPIAETKEWLKLHVEDYAFVDPEIGHMASAAHESNMLFSYLHIVSDILGQPGNENLSNERDLHIINKRKDAYTKIVKILKQTLKNIDLD